MARGNIPVTSIVRAGVAAASETTGDPTNNHQLANNGSTTFLVARNTNGASTARTLTVRLPGLRDGQTISPRTYSIAAGATRYIGPFPTKDYGGTLQVDVDNAELMLRAFQI